MAWPDDLRHNQYHLGLGPTPSNPPSLAFSNPPNFWQSNANDNVGFPRLPDQTQNPTTAHLNQPASRDNDHNFEITETEEQAVINGDRLTIGRANACTTSSRQATCRKPRTRQPGDAQWQKNKAHIEKLYMEYNLPLSEVVKSMEGDYGFSASEKMYKNKFKQWRWSKNLPFEKAMWMNEKLKQRKSETVFSWNHQEWSAERISQICERKSESQLQARSAADAKTPTEIQYWTPRPVPNTPSVPPTPQNGPDVQEHHPENFQRNPQRFYLDQPPVNLNMRNTTVSDLRELLESATRFASDGNLEEANTDFRDAVAGFRLLLSPTHDETLKAGYLYASFYAHNGEMSKADEVLDWICKANQSKWGFRHEKTYLNYARIIELLRSWNRKEHAESLVYKLLEGLEDAGGEMQLDFTGLTRSESQRLFQDGGIPTQSFPETNNSDLIRRQLNTIDLAVMTDMTGLDSVLQTIVRHCDDGSSRHLSLQGCRAKCALAKYKMASGHTEEALQLLQSARTSLGPSLVVSSEPIARNIVETARQLAFTFFEANDEPACKDLLDEVIAVLEARLSLPDCVGGNIEETALIDFVISTASHFHKKSSWDAHRYWLGRALGIAIRHFGSKSPVARRLQNMLQKKEFDRDYSTILSDLMGFSKGRFFVQLV